MNNKDRGLRREERPKGISRSLWRSTGPEMDPIDVSKKQGNRHVFLTLVFFALRFPLRLALSGRGVWLGEQSEDDQSAILVGLKL